MKTISHFFILSIVCFCACSSTYRLKDDDLTINELAGDLRNESVTIVLSNGEKHSGYNLILIENLLYWKDSRSDTTHSIPVNKVSKIIDKQHGQGALDGLGYGFLGGFTLGAIIGIAATDPDHQSSEFMDATPRDYGEGALGYGLVFAIPSALVGLPVGAITGHKYIYIINEQPIKKPEYVNIKVESVVEDNNAYITVKRLGSNIKIKRSHIKNIEKSGTDIFITISKKVYEENFKGFTIKVFQDALDGFFDSAKL